MTENIFDRVRNTFGDPLDRSAYHADSDRVQASVPGGIIWKLERSQFFNESGDSAWEAFLHGDWNRVMEIFDSEREAVRDEVREFAACGLELRRLRVVEVPPSPYLQWEMHSHRVFAECGHHIRTLDARAVAGLEHARQLPELMVYGGRVLYQVRYDSMWTPDGAKRVDDPELVGQVATAVADLWERAEPFPRYFHREIAPLALPERAPDRYLGEHAAS